MNSKSVLALLAVVVICVSSASYILLFRPEKSDTDPVTVQYDMIELERVDSANFGSAVVDIIVLDEVVWVATGSDGIYKLNRDLEVLTHYTKSNTSNGLLSDRGRCLAIDGDDLWVGTHLGVSVLNTEDGVWKTYNTLNGLGGPPINDTDVGPEIGSIVVENDTVWVSVISPWTEHPGRDGEVIGLNKYNKSTEEWTFYSFLNRHLPYNMRIIDMKMDGDKLWLVSMDYLKISYFNISSEEHSFISSPPLIPVFALDDENILTAGLHPFNIYIFNKETMKITKTVEIEETRALVPETRTMQVKDDFIFIPVKNGLLCLNMTSERYVVFNQSHNPPSEITRVLHVEGLQLWMGAGSGVYVFNMSTRIITIEEGGIGY